MYRYKSPAVPPFLPASPSPATRIRVPSSTPAGIFTDNDFSFCQIKTMKGTLTGSQKPRSENELKIYEKSYFVSALNLGNWTFNSKFIPRIAGKDFWNLIEIDYEFIIFNLKRMISKMEGFSARLVHLKKENPSSLVQDKKNESAD